MGPTGCVQSEVCGGWARWEVLPSQGDQRGLTRVDMDVKPPHSPIKQPTGLRSWLCHWSDVWTSYLTSLSLCFPVCKMGTTQRVPTARAVGRMRPRLTAGGQPCPCLRTSKGSSLAAVLGRTGPTSCPMSCHPSFLLQISTPFPILRVHTGEDSRSLDCLLPCWERGSRTTGLARSPCNSATSP